jgi:hypothetical protein
MTPYTTARLKALGLTGRGFAALTGIHPQTVQGWGNERYGRGLQTEPAWVGLLLDAWEAAPQTLAVALAETASAT